MSAEDIAICSMCDITFDSHDKVIGHTCIEIKEEKLEIEGMISDQEDIKDACYLSENDSEYCPIRKKSKRNNATKSKIKEGQSNGKLKIDAKKRKKIQKMYLKHSNVQSVFLAFLKRGP